MANPIGGTTTGPKPVGGTALEDVSDVGGKKPAVKPAETKGSELESPRQMKGAQQHAISQKVEEKLHTEAKGLKPPAPKEKQISAMLDAAKSSGLEDKEVNKLKTHLQGLDTAKFESESSFLRNHVLHSANTDRALRTYNELNSLQAGPGAQRLTNEHIHTLTRGVAESRTNTTRGQEGVLGQDAAINAGKALINMPNGDYKRLNGMLNEAGKGKDGKLPNGGSPQMEKALILKAVAARHQELSNPSVNERLKTWVGKPSSAMAEVQGFAQDIRGLQRSTLAQNSTATDPYTGNSALQQRWNDSCGPTTAQGIKADADPVYAFKLHKEFIHNQGPRGEIAKEQKQVLEKHGGVAVQRGGAGGQGVPGSKLWNDQISKYTGVKYTAQPCVDSAVNTLKKGIDVPIRAGWPGGGGHFMFLSDVRGSGENQRFLLTDPWQGTTSWITRKDLASGNTQFPAGTGKLTHIY